MPVHRTFYSRLTRPRFLMHDSALYLCVKKDTQVDSGALYLTAVAFSHAPS